MTEGDSSARFDALEKQMEIMDSTLTQLVNLFQGKDKKEESSSKGKKKLVKSDGEGEETDSDEETEIVKTVPYQGVKGSYQNLKICFKVEIPVYDGSVNVERLDDWIERMEIFYPLRIFI